MRLMNRRDRRTLWRSKQCCQWRSWSLLALIAGCTLFVACAEPQQAPADRLPQTGYVVQPPFAPYYELYGPQFLGEPISGLCEVAGGGQAQYFQYMRLEVAVDGQSVTIYPLGAWAYAGLRRKTEAPLPDGSRTREFPETGFIVRDEFLDYYERSSGETLLGPPISAQVDEGTLRVQYFRNGRLEWHPDAPPEQRVRLGMLGQAHYLQAAHDVTCDFRARPVDVSTVRDVEVLASAEAPILYTGDQQMIYAMVTTDAGVPVTGVPVILTLRDTEWTLTVDLGLTDGSGKVHGGLQMPIFEPGRMVGVSVEAQGLQGLSIGKTGLAFQTWW